jgi:hypothetical protein
MRSYLYTILLGLSGILQLSCSTEIRKYEHINRQPVIFPDYTGILIPPNIAPLNFRIDEPGSNYLVKFYTFGKDTLIIRNHHPLIQVDLNNWRDLMDAGKGGKLYMDVFVCKPDKNWQKFQTITNEIASVKIDNHLAYRLINAGYIFWNKLGIWQRNLENFDEEPILENKSFEYGCLNCHSFCNNNPDYMLLHTRAVHGGTIINQNGVLRKIDTRNKYLLSAGVYPSWHPDGNHIAFSVNTINQHFATGDVRIEVSDLYSDLVVYDIKNNTLVTSPRVSTEARENLPTWSPDGKYIYFISAPPVVHLEDRINAKYDLLRIGFDVLSDTWGEVDTILSARKTGKSISFPKISPNGKFLMFCMSDHGYFTIHQPMADLYLLDLETGIYKKMEINSPQTDSYHGFSHEGHWFVFSSKRMDGLYTRPFFSYLDENGNASKPFVLPQKDPEFYERYLKNYNVPELITGAVNVSALAFRDKVLETAEPARLDPGVDTTYLKMHLKKKP